MSLMGDVQKFIESHPGCTSSDIANAFADFPRKSVLQSTSKLRQCGRVAHRFEGKTRRHFALETDIPPDQEPDTDSATYQIGKTITVMANCERNGGSGAITVTININGQVKTAEVMPYTAGIPAMYQTVVFSVYTTSPVVDISVSLRVGGQYTTEASVWPLVMVSRSGNNFTN